MNELIIMLYSTNLFQFAYQTLALMKKKIWYMNHNYLQ